MGKFSMLWWKGCAMTATYMRIGVPIAEKRPGMTYNEVARFWISNVDDRDCKIERLRFEESTSRGLHRRLHVAYAVDDPDGYLADADRVICGPMVVSSSVRPAFVEKDGVVIEFCEGKQRPETNARPLTGAGVPVSLLVAGSAFEHLLVMAAVACCAGLVFYRLGGMHPVAVCARDAVVAFAWR